MNVRGDITTEWADGVYAFRLTLAGAIELEEKCDAPIAVIAHRLNSGLYKVQDVRETIRIGLIGGGTPPADALKLVSRYVDDRPLVESYVIARLVMGGLMFGFETAPLGKEAAGPEAAPPSPPGSTPPPPTNPSPPSSLDTLLDRWDYGNFTPS